MPMLLPLVLLLFQSGDLDKACQDAEKLAAEGNFGRAVAVLRDAGAEASKDAMALTMLGTCMLRDAESRAAAGSLTGLQVHDAFGEAGNVLRKATKASGAPPEAWTNLSETQVNASDFRNAEKTVVAGLRKHKGDLSLMLQFGRVLGAKAAELGEDPKAIAGRGEARDAYAAARKAHPESGVAAVRHGEMLALLQDIPGATAAWRDALRLDPATVDLATLGQWIGSPAAADLLAEYNQTGTPDALRMWWQAYNEYFALDRWPAAKASFHKVLELAPEFNNAWYFLGDGGVTAGGRLAQANDMKAANREYDDAAAAWATYLNAAGAHQIQQLGAMEDGGEKFIATQKWLAGTAYGHGKVDSSVAISRWVSQARPADPEAWNNYAFFLRENRQAEESLVAYRRALGLQPEDPQVMNDLAVILHYYLRRDTDEAASLYEKAAARAEAILANADALAPPERERIQIALRDARNNLARLRAGSTDDPGTPPGEGDSGKGDGD